ncbi:MAG: Tyrosine recombinase XerC [Syntrophorhabdaceae bacterium PtaU1.Bin034]|nr:MAG: Tyrosine recombinase XerC [Syntrophorhabdaceae bacterium PtaU1.Bin034]
MVGHVRAKGKCPICAEPFTEVPKLGFLCFEHQTVPKRFYVDLPWKGERIRVFSDTTGQVLDSYDRAEKIRERIESELEDHSFDPTRYVTAEASKFWAENLLDTFERDKIATVAPSYKKDYRRMVRIAKAFFKRQDVRDIRKVHIIDYMKDCQEKYSWKEKTLKNNMDLFKVFMNYLKNDLEIISKVPAFPEVEVPDAPINWVHATDQVTLYELVADEDKPIIGFLMLHGCRPGEARAIKCKDVDLETESITIHATFSKNEYREKRKGKKSKPYVVAIHPESLDFVKSRVQASLPEAFLFINPRTGNPYTMQGILGVWEKVREKGKISDELRLYDASRHSFASQLVNQNVPLNKISKLLGHSSTKMTEKYAHHELESLRIDLSLMSLKKRETVTRLSLKGNEGAKKP